jgi:hypothetical protein
MPRPQPPQFTASGFSFSGDTLTIAGVAGGAATGNTNTTPSGEYHTFRCTVSGVSFTGGTTPTVTPVVQTSPDGGTWTDMTPSAGTFAGYAAGATGRVVLSGFDRLVRVRWTTTGTPTAVNFTMTAEAI